MARTAQMHQSLARRSQRRRMQRSPSLKKVYRNIRSKFLSRSSSMRCESSLRSKRSSSTSSDIVSSRGRFRPIYRSRRANSPKYRSRFTFLPNRPSKLRQTRRPSSAKSKTCKAQWSRCNTMTSNSATNSTSSLKAINFFRNKFNSERARWPRLFSHSSNSRRPTGSLRLN